MKPGLDRPLYLERWLLDLQRAAVARGLEAHVRALDRKGGDLLALEVRDGQEALELRYRKLRLTARMVAAASGPVVAARVKDVHREVLAAHGRLLENGLRRFLRRSIRLLGALEDALRKRMGSERELPAEARSAGGRPALVARRQFRAAEPYEVLPGAVFIHRERALFGWIRDGKVLDLSALLYPKPGRPREGRRTSVEDLPDWILDIPDLVMGVLDSIPRAPVTRSAAEAMKAVPAAEAFTGPVEALPGTVEVFTGPVEALPEAVQAAATGAEAVAEGGSILVKAVEITGEAVSSSGSCLADASCAGLDCGALDCIPG